MKTNKILLSLVLISSFAFAQTPKQLEDSLRKLGSAQQKIADNFNRIADSIKKANEPVVYWKKGGMFNLGGTQVSLTNWAAGGQNSITIGSLFNAYANYSKNSLTWDNSVNMQYALIRQGKSKDWWKNDDQFQITSKFGLKLTPTNQNWYYSALADFKSQFTPGYNYPNDSVRISTLLAPGYGIVALGMDYKLKDFFSATVAPVTGKFTIVNDETLADAGAFGVKAAEKDTAGKTIKHGEKFRAEVGGYVKIRFKKDILKGVNFETNVELFSNYLNNPGNIDVSWTTLLSMKINKYLSTTFSTHLIYDDDVDVAVDRDGDDVFEASAPRVQFKQVLSVGFSYKF